MDMVDKNTKWLANSCTMISDQGKLWKKSWILYVKISKIEIVMGMGMGMGKKRVYQ